MRILLNGVACLFVCMLAFAVGENRAVADEASTGSFSVGLLLPLTGPLAEYGVAVQNGIAMAKEAAPEKFKHCAFHAEDHAYLPKNAVSQFQKLRGVDRVHLIYGWGGPPSEAVAPLAEKFRIPAVFWSADPKISENRKFVLRFTNRGSEYGQPLAKALAAAGAKRLGIVRAENQYLNIILAGLKESLSEGQTLDIIDSYEPSASDFRSSVSKLRGDRFDAVGVFLISGQVSQFYRQAVEQKLIFKSFGTDFFESQTEVKNANGGMNGAIYANNDVSPAFRSAYEKKFGNDLQIGHAGNGYDFANLVCDLFASAPDTGRTPDAILTSLANVRGAHGVLGDFSFVEAPGGDKYFRFPVVMKKIAGLKIVTDNESQAPRR